MLNTNLEAKLLSLMNDMKNDDALISLFDIYNRYYFNNQLSNEIVIKWSERMTRAAGKYRIKRNRGFDKDDMPCGEYDESITLSAPYHRKYPQDIKSTLLHEMIHAEFPDAGHGQIFIDRMESLNKQHNLNIAVHSKGRAVVNYTYTCKECGKVHSRSKRLLQYNVCRCKCGGALIEKIL